MRTPEFRIALWLGLFASLLAFPVKAWLPAVAFFGTLIVLTFPKRSEVLVVHSEDKDKPTKPEVVTLPAAQVGSGFETPAVVRSSKKVAARAAMAANPRDGIAPGGESEEDFLLRHSSQSARAGWGD